MLSSFNSFCLSPQLLFYGIFYSNDPTASIISVATKLRISKIMIMEIHFVGLQSMFGFRPLSCVVNISSLVLHQPHPGNIVNPP